MLIDITADARRSLSQHLRHPYARQRNEEINFHFQPATSASYNEPCALNFWLANVIGAWQTFSTYLPAIVIWRQPSRSRLLYCAETEYSELSEQHWWAQELCAGHINACKSATVIAGHAKKEQRILCATVSWFRPAIAPILLRNRASSASHAYRSSTTTRPKCAWSDGTRALRVSYTAQLRHGDEAYT